MAQRLSRAKKWALAGIGGALLLFVAVNVHWWRKDSAAWSAATEVGQALRSSDAKVRERALRGLADGCGEPFLYRKVLELGALGEDAPHVHKDSIVTVTYEKPVHTRLTFSQATSTCGESHADLALLFVQRGSEEKDLFVHPDPFPDVGF